jgi:hypothetical protein
LVQQLGIELSGNACRVVAVVPGAEATCVRRFESLRLNDPATAVRLNRFRGRRASVVAWAIAADHTRVVVDDASYERMGAAARARVAALGREVQDSLSDIAPAFPPADVGAQRALILTSAPRAAVDRVLRPITDAGIRINTLTTAAGALVSLARLRRSLTEPDAVELYVALDESATCLTVVSGGVLASTRTLDWGFRDPAVSRPADRVSLVQRFSESATAFLRETGQLDRVSQVCVCGSMPGLRSMCASLNLQLEIEVEPLDSLFGIDADHLPRPTDGFRERAAELRLAWAVAADPRLQLDLFRPRTRHATAIRFARGAVAAGVVAGMGVGLAVQSRWPLPSVSARAQARESSSQIGQDSEEAARTGASATTAAHSERGSASSGLAVPAAVVSGEGERAPRGPRSVPSEERPGDNEMPARSPQESAQRVGEIAIPFQGQLTSILLSADRAVAIIDGQIVEPGGMIRGARVVEISERKVLLRDAAGRLRRLEMVGGGS